MKDIAIEFLGMAARGHARSAFERFAAPNFVHHNPYFPADWVSLAQGMDENARQFPGKKLTVERAIEEGDVVIVYSRVQHAPDMGEVAVVHIFRFESGKIVELWDVAMAVPKDSPNQLGAF